MEKKILKHKFKCKSKNRRIEVKIFSDGKTEPVITVLTKRLIDFKSRNISSYEGVFSVETFIVLSDILSEFKSVPEIKKMLNPFSKFEIWQGDHVEYQPD
jgi:hypothetical protein